MQLPCGRPVSFSCANKLAAYGVISVRQLAGSSLHGGVVSVRGCGLMPLRGGRGVSGMAIPTSAVLMTCLWTPSGDARQFPYLGERNA